MNVDPVTASPALVWSKTVIAPSAAYKSAVHESPLHGHEINGASGLLPASLILLYQAEVVIGGEIRVRQRQKKMV
jgi:hypothetical protein